ncbi:MAG: TetR/AcrR family transcriptional regulator [Agathobacter sp.]
MYQGTNPTALQSQQWLMESLIALMEEKPFSQITILDICKQADLSRQTFYNFFSTKEEILHLYLQQQCKKQFYKYKEKSSISIEDIVKAFSDVLILNEQLLNSMLKNELDSIIADEVSESVALFANHFVNKCSSNDILPYSEALLSGALAQLIVFWFKQENPISIEEITELLTDFFRGKLYGLN